MGAKSALATYRVGGQSGLHQIPSLKALNKRGKLRPMNIVPGVHLASRVALGFWGALEGCGRLGVPHT